MVQGIGTFRQSRLRVWTEGAGTVLLLTLTAVGLYCAGSSGLTMARGQLRWGYAAMLFMVALLGIPVGIVWMVTLRSKLKAWSRARVGLLGMAWCALTLALFAALFINWPLRLSFALERAPLEALAQRVERGETPAMPLQMGAWTITGTEKDAQGRVWLWLCPHGNASCRASALIHCAPNKMPPNRELYAQGLNDSVELARTWRCYGYGG